MQKYLLLVDREEDILELQEAALRYFYGGQIIASRSREDAINALSDLGRPEIIISSLAILREGLHSHLLENGTYLPLIATGGANEEKFEGLKLVTSFLSGRVCPEELSLLVKSLTHAPPQSPTHIPIKLKVACEVASGKFDIYLKLSGTNFVKITNRGSEFSIFEAEKLSSKGIFEVYLKASESRDFLRMWEDSLITKLTIHKPDDGGETIIAMDCLEQVEKISRALGWSSESLKASRKIIREAIASLNNNERISALLKKKFSEGNSGYAHHIGLLSYLSCMMCSELKMDDSREKLVMASLMHDLSLEENTYSNIEEWNKQARNLGERSPEIVRYRLHPLHASQTAQTLDVLPPDVDQIILQHHEAPDGSGYPRGLTANRIHYLAAVFIIAEDLIGFLGDGEALETSLKDFLTWGENRYQQGNFKKIFDGIRQKVS